MLESLLLPQPQALESFKRWSSRVDLEKLGFSDLRLVPALYMKFADSLDNGALRVHMKGICRFYSCLSQRLAAAGRSAIEHMQAEGIDPILFKGAAIAPKYHGNISTRPMADVDVLIRRADIEKAEAVLQGLGFRCPYSEEKKKSYLHSYDYVKDGPGGFDLHWYSLYESRQPGIDDGIWERAEFFDWDGLVVKVMSPEDLLLTTIVNGVREPTPMRPHWIHDVATIIRAEPVILWETLWGEATRRGLREKVFDALNMVRGLSNDIVPNAVLDSILIGDPDFCRETENAGIARRAGRRSGSPGRGNRASRQRTSALETPTAPSMVKRGDSGRADLLGYIRYRMNDEGAIVGVSLQSRHLPFLQESFEVSDPELLRTMVAECDRSGEVDMPLPPGLLAKMLKPVLPTYDARIVVHGSGQLMLAPGEQTEIALDVENTSSSCWPVCGASIALFGVSYHLLAEDGTMVQWDGPRDFFSVARWGCVVLVEPSRKLHCRLPVVAPMVPGKYSVQLDIVQEHVQWFSGKDVQFPGIELEVLPQPLADHYVVGGRHIVHETIENETAILDGFKGTYFMARGHASRIWDAIVAGHSVKDIDSAFAEAGIFAGEEHVVARFVADLLSENLIKAAENGPVGRVGKFRVKGDCERRAPELLRYPEARELLARHPVRGASQSAGWPEQNGPSDPGILASSKRRSVTEGR